MDGFVEWTFEGSFETASAGQIVSGRGVGTDGDHDRYLVAYM